MTGRRAEVFTAVTSLDVSAVVGHHAMPAALLFYFGFLRVLAVSDISFLMPLPVTFRLPFMSSVWDGAPAPFINTQAFLI